MRKLVAFALASLATFAWGQTTQTTQPTLLEANRQMAGLPDFAHGTGGILGPLYWGRSIDVGEDAYFCDENRIPSATGEFLWLMGFNRVNTKGDTRGLNGTFLHGRNNFVSRDPKTVFGVQTHMFLNMTDGPHNAKLALGYVADDYRFKHGDNSDLEHLADCDRIVLFIPVRHDTGIQDKANQDQYYVNPQYGAQTPSVLQFEAGEMIRYEWFRDPKKLDPHILFDLAPHIAENRAKAIRPGVTRPIFEFSLTGEPGGWRVRIRKDGRDGKYPQKDADWDLSFSDKSPGAKPFNVKLDPAKARWSLSTFAPGGSPADTCQVQIKLFPREATTLEAKEWPDRKARVRSAKLEQLGDLGEKPKPGVAK